MPFLYLKLYLMNVFKIKYKIFPKNPVFLAFLEKNYI